jgi:hypothetical protein
MGRIEMVLTMFRHRLAEAERLADESERAAQSGSPEVRETAMLATAFFRGVASAYQREIGGIEDAIEYRREIGGQDAPREQKLEQKLEQGRDWN